MNRISIINSLISKNKYTDYLEIGVRDGECFNAIHCENKVGVDPDPDSKATLFMTSDEFFELNTAKFDIVFIDGLHHSDQVYKDIINSLNCLKKGGTIVMHDCLPTTKRMQEIPLEEQQEWTGDVWKAFLKLRQEREDLIMHTVDCDWGCGIIRKGSGYSIPVTDEVTYENFCRHKNLWMNIISPDEFKKLYITKK